MLPLTWATVLQDDGQEEVLGEHGACSQPLLPPPSLLTAPPAQPAGLTAWCWAAEKSSSRPLLTRAERLPGKIDLPIWGGQLPFHFHLIFLGVSCDNLIHLCR